MRGIPTQLSVAVGGCTEVTAPPGNIAGPTRAAFRCGLAMSISLSAKNVHGRHAQSGRNPQRFSAAGGGGAAGGAKGPVLGMTRAGPGAGGGGGSSPAGGGKMVLLGAGAGWAKMGQGHKAIIK